MFKFNRSKPDTKDEKERGDYEALLADSEDGTQPIQKRRKSTTSVVLLVLSHLLIAVGGFLLGRVLFFSADDFCAHHVNHYCEYCQTLAAGRSVDTS